MALVHFFVTATQLQLVRINGVARTGCRGWPKTDAAQAAMHQLQIGFIDRNVDGVGTHGRSVVRSPHLASKRATARADRCWRASHCGRSAGRSIGRSDARQNRCTEVFVRARLKAGGSRAASKASPGGLLVALPKRSVGVHCWRSGVDRSAQHGNRSMPLPRACLLRFRRGRPVDLRARTPACGISPNRRRQGVGRLVRPWTFRESSPCGRDATIGTIPTSSNEISGIHSDRRARPRRRPCALGLVMPLVPFVVDSSEPAARPFRRHVGECCGDRRRQPNGSWGGYHVYTVR